MTEPGASQQWILERLRRARVEAAFDAGVAQELPNEVNLRHAEWSRVTVDFLENVCREVIGCEPPDSGSEGV